MSSCLSPIWLEHRHTYVPCGKCYNCVSQRRNAWTFRLLCESFTHKHSAFLTLTYRDLPLIRVGTPSEFIPTLVVDHIKSFFKSIRNSGYKIKYYAIGEYGGKLGRPHYHAIVFYDDDKLNFREHWTRGMVHEGRVTPKSIHYVSKFHMYPKTSSRHNLSPVRPFRTDVQETRMEFPFELFGL